MTIELELKYSLLDDHVPAAAELRAAFAGSGVEVAGPTLLRQKDRYFDDARLSLSRAGLALRRRMVDGAMLATLKTRGRVDGALHRREELELPLRERGWPGPIHDRLALVTDPAALKPVLELDTERVRFVLLRDGRPAATLTFDAVAARSPGAESRVHFAELELEAAGATDEATLRGLAERLEGLLRLNPSGVTKLERAQALLLAGAGLGGEPGAADG